MSVQLLFEKQLSRGKFQVYSDQPSFFTITVKQTHSDIVLQETEASQKEADGIIGNSNKPLGVLTADCIPIVLIGSHEHAIIHAGWAGLEKKILANPIVQKMKPTEAFIGPHIRTLNYEVQTDFKKHFPDSNSFKEYENKLFFNLTNEVTDQLQNFYPKISISDCEICTFSDKNFNSYRRNKTTKRNWNLYLPEGHLL